MIARLRLRYLVGVMGEDELAGAAVQVVLGPEQPVGYRRVLYVPARPAVEFDRLSLDL